jgi:beta-barrel assembly-enhancing protease
VAKTLFEAIGYRLGKKAAQAKNAFELMGGTEAESLRAEIRLGRDLAAAMAQRRPLAVENETTRFAAQIVKWLAAHVKEKQLPFRVWVTAEQQPNTLALPGGAIFLSCPMLEICQGQRDEMAFLLGHEMGHIVRRHTLERIVKDAAVSLLLRQTSGKNAATAWLEGAGRQVLTRAYSKEAELEADTFAVRLLKTAGGEEGAALRLLEKFAPLAIGAPGGTGDYFATHPPVAERIAHLRAGERS